MTLTDPSSPSFFMTDSPFRSRPFPTNQDEGHLLAEIFRYGATHWKVVCCPEYLGLRKHEGEKCTHGYFRWVPSDELKVIDRYGEEDLYATAALREFHAKVVAERMRRRIDA